MPNAVIRKSFLHNCRIFVTHNVVMLSGVAPLSTPSLRKTTDLIMDTNDGFSGLQKFLSGRPLHLKLVEVDGTHRLPTRARRRVSGRGRGADSWTPYASGNNVVKLSYFLNDFSGRIRWSIWTWQAFLPYSNTRGRGQELRQIKISSIRFRPYRQIFFVMFARAEERTWDLFSSLSLTL